MTSSPSLSEGKPGEDLDRGPQARKSEGRDTRTRDLNSESVMVREQPIFFDRICRLCLILLFFGISGDDAALLLMSP